MVGTMKEMKTVKFCDLCNSTHRNTGVLDTCVVCGREYGWCCKVQIYNVYGIHICKECWKKPPYHQMMVGHLERWRAARQSIKAELQIAEEPATELLANPFNDDISHPTCPNCGSSNVFMEDYVRFCTLCKKDLGVHVIVEVPGKWRSNKTVSGRFYDPKEEK